MIIAFGWALAAEPPVFQAPSPLLGPIEEVAHPEYVDAMGQPVDWNEIRDLAHGSDATRRVRSRRWGRTLLRITFAAAAGAEAYGTWELARRDSFWAAPLGAQAGLTGLCAVLLWTGAPGDRREDRTILLEGANGVLVSPPSR